MLLSSRRAVLGGGLAAFAAGCAHAQTPTRPRLTPVNLNEDQIVRVDVGLRPYRRSGFRVAREQQGAKAIIHNYGHGGGGISLSWGSAKLAVDLGYDSAQRDYAILGAGVMGLSTARLLQERGANVTIYASAFSPNTTSNIAGAQWWPASVYETAHASSAYLAQHLAASRYAFRRFQSYAGDDYGVAWETNWVVAEEPILTEPATADSPMQEFVVGQRDYAPGTSPFAARHVRSFETMMLETPHYLRRLERDVRADGGAFNIRTFSNRTELNALPQTTIFNCTGLGAGALFGDTEIQPVRGQLVIMLPQPAITYNIITLGDLYMFGRRDGVVLGGTFQPDNWSTDPNADDTNTILAGHREIFRGM